ncbi:hypothetical protein VCR14J2_610235 [Vibrio coralliirubri]|nr:hypothetical protein VCR14J2_610235 [Vibrio coralliirubri]
MLMAMYNPSIHINWAQRGWFYLQLFNLIAYSRLKSSTFAHSKDGFLYKRTLHSRTTPTKT